jgi:DNA primase
MHGLLNGSKPTGGKLKGSEFQRVRDVLAGKTASATRQVQNASTQKKESSAKTSAEASSVEKPILVNQPLINSADERIRELHDIDSKFVTDLAVMNPKAAAYVRRHPCLTPESMKKWRCGYLPNDGGGDKRGWSLRGNIVYPVLSETGRVLAWVGRDVTYEEKEQAFQRLTPTERTGKEPPVKHRFPKGFHRGNELFGQHASRLNEPGYRDFIAKHGLIIVEGFNDVINLDNLGVPALAIMSNRITEAQVSKIATWAKQFANNQVVVMLDCDASGLDGSKELAWYLLKHKIHVRLTNCSEELESEGFPIEPERIDNAGADRLFWR